LQAGRGGTKCLKSRRKRRDSANARLAWQARRQQFEPAILHSIVVEKGPILTGLFVRQWCGSVAVTAGDAQKNEEKSQKYGSQPRERFV
jgi:hypothetical protein